MEFSYERERIADQPVSILITTRNDAGRLPKLLAELPPLLAKLNRPCEILVVDGGSTDATQQIVTEAASRIPALRWLPQSSFQGEGEAVQVGIAAATHPLLFILPAWTGVGPEVLSTFLDQIDAVDLVAGMRAGLTRWQRFQEAGSAWWLFGVTLTDAACPIRFYRKVLFERWPLQSKGPFLHLEIVAKANFTGGLMSEVAVPAFSGSPPTGQPSSWKELMRLFGRPQFLKPTEPLAAAEGSSS